MRKLASGWTPYILDVRSRSEAQHSGVVKGCNLVHPHTSIRKARKSIPRDRDILVICQGGFRADKAIDELVTIGYEPHHLFNLKGGAMAWSRSGGEFKPYSNQIQ